MKEEKLEAVALQGHTDRGYFHEEFSYKDLPEMDYPVVEWPLAVPSDLREKVAIARQANPQGTFMSTQTLREELLGVKDNLLEQERIARDRLDAMPQVAILEQILKAEDKIEGLKAEGENRAADTLQAFVDSLFLALENPQGNQPASGTPTNGASPAMPGRPGGGTTVRRGPFGAT